jgi:hypothetical protein
MVMTQQYLAGELSLLLAQLQAVASDQPNVVDVARLRQEAETLPVAALTSVTVRALRLIDVLCWDSVARGDAVAFDRQAAVSAELYEFGVCADLLDEALPYLMVSGREVER